MDEQTQREWAERTVRAVSEALPDVVDYRNWPLCQQYLPHIQSRRDSIDRWNFVFSEAATLCNNVRLYLNEHVRNAEAEEYYQRAFAIYEQTLGPEHSDLATNLNNLASLYYSQGKYALAEPLYQRAISIDDKILGPEHPNTILHRENFEIFLRRRDKGKGR